MKWGIALRETPLFKDSAWGFAKLLLLSNLDSSLVEGFLVGSLVFVGFSLRGAAFDLGVAKFSLLEYNVE